MTKRRTKKLVYKAEFLREEFLEVQDIHDDARRDFFSRIREIQSDLNVYDPELDDGYQMTGPSEINDQTPDLHEDETVEECIHDIDEVSKEKQAHPAWAKSLYRQISIKTHPDKLLNSDDEDKREKIEVYNQASKSYSERDYSVLVLIAVDLKLTLPENVQINDILSEKCDEYLSDTKVLKGTLFWSWHHSTEEQRKLILGDFIKKRGWTDPRAAMKKSRNKKHPGKSIAWARKKFADEEGESQ